MEIICLIENTQGHALCAAEHGLSVYVSTQNHKILCDAGQTDAIIKNAGIMNVDLNKVDSFFLSHGHYDHSGGIEAFRKINNHAKIYLKKEALLPFFHFEKYIGVSEKITELDNLIFTENYLKIDDEISVFSAIKGRRLFPETNSELFINSDGKLIRDSFSHEQCTVISEKGKSVLISGCAHNGILNILDRYRELYGGEPDAVVSGFHMMKKTDCTENDIRLIEETAEELSGMKTVFYTGHCTGQAAFEIMKNIMGDKLNAIHSGQKVACL